MKKILLLLIIAMLFPMMVGAQNTGLQSVESESSIGLFGNELDAALTVSETGNKPAFSELEGNYLFAGLSNLNGVIASGLFTANVDPTNLATTDDPLWAGCYFAGEMPWSIFASFYAGNATGNQDNTTNYTDSGTPVTVDTVTYQYNIAESIRTYNRNKLFDDLKSDAQFLISLGEINTGVYLRLIMDDNTNQANNWTQVDTTLNNSAGGGEIPVESAYEIHTTGQKAIDTTTQIRLGIPLFLKTGDLAHTANIVTDITLNDDSTGAIDEYSGTAQAAATIAGVGTSNQNIGDFQMNIDLDYNLTMPGLFGTHPNNELNINPSLNIGLTNFWIDGTTETRTYDYASVGASPTNTLTANSETTQNGGGFDFGFALNASNSLYYDFEPGIRYGFNPSFGISFAQNNPDLLDTRTVITRTDGDGDEAFTSAADGINTVTTTYQNTNVLGGNASTSTTINTYCFLPMGIEFKPADWPVKLILGSVPVINNTMTWTTTAIAHNTVDTLTTNGDQSTITTDTTINAVSSNTTMAFDSSFSVVAMHNIGMSMELGPNVNLDISLDMSSDTNVLDFKNLVVQALVKLPN